MRLPARTLALLSHASPWLKLRYFFIGAQDLLRERATPRAPAAVRSQVRRRRKVHRLLEVPVAFLLAGATLVLGAQLLGHAAREQLIPGAWLSTGLVAGAHLLLLALAVGGVRWGYLRGRALAQAFDALVLRGYEIRTGLRAPWPPRGR